jgi:hypothetical protein
MKKILLILMVFLMFTGYSEETFEYKYSFINDESETQYGSSSLVISSDTTNTHFINYIKLTFKEKTFELESHNLVIDKNYNKLYFIDKNIYGIRSITILGESVILNINNIKYILTNNNPNIKDNRVCSFGERDSKNTIDTTIYIGIDELQVNYMKRVYELAKTYKKVIYIKETEKDWIIYLRKKD